MKKTTAINIMVEAETKKRLKEKARALNLTLTAYIEKVALEPVCFLDQNVKLIIKSLNMSM